MTHCLCSIVFRGALRNELASQNNEAVDKNKLLVKKAK